MLHTIQQKYFRFTIINYHHWYHSSYNQNSFLDKGTGSAFLANLAGVLFLTTLLALAPAFGFGSSFFSSFFSGSGGGYIDFI